MRLTTNNITTPARVHIYIYQSCSKYYTAKAMSLALDESIPGGVLEICNLIGPTPSDKTPARGLRGRDRNMFRTSSRSIWVFDCYLFTETN